MATPRRSTSRRRVPTDIRLGEKSQWSTVLSYTRISILPRLGNISRWLLPDGSTIIAEFGPVNEATTGAIRRCIPMVSCKQATRKRLSLSQVEPPQRRLCRRTDLSAKPGPGSGSMTQLGIKSQPASAMTKTAHTSRSSARAATSATD